MSIRVATQADVPRILDLGEEMHAESPRWSRLSFSRERAGETLHTLLTSDDGVVYVAERGGEIIGGIAGAIGPHWSSDDRLAREVSLFITKEARGSLAASRLIVALQAWAKLRGAIWTDVGTSTGLDPEVTARLYELHGAVRCSIGLEFLNV
ncbi:hypothetical protein LMG18090_04047 [Ralstonia mannitolilytica]|uniref:GNAT family N-acetyltransferase n=1 Tax=Ralstonia mannitolilytica TaxID=105219 RepID=UPI0028F4F1F9|nr:GNAT family N-acetyltransferase [Ralstonia mannitolilytica]CAJ0800794.1 hypothetical protein LMG18090_04047 [Ralstonia mannitolilytica]